MYPVGGWLGLLRSGRTSRVGSPRAVSGNVLLLGLTSLFTDISSEMVVAILPAYLVGFLRLTPAQFGLVDGVYQGVSSLAQLASGALTDRFQRYKEMAAVGYLASTLSRVGLLLTAQWPVITSLLAIDRIGKGIRTSPRDALISLSVEREDLTVAFGTHRALDACGAMLGPVLAFLTLMAVGRGQRGFDAVFAVSLFCAVVGVAVLVFFVENRPATGPKPDHQNRPRSSLFQMLRHPRFRHLASCTLLLSAATIGDGFVYLALQEQGGVSMSIFPLLYVGTSAGFLLLALPVARLADRVGRFPVFLAGHVVLVGLYAWLPLMPASGVSALLAVAALGLYYAATDGVLAALGSALIPPDRRASGLAILTTTTAVARLVSSLVFGLIWTRFGLTTAIVGFAIALAAAVAISVAALPRGLQEEG